MPSVISNNLITLFAVAGCGWAFTLHAQETSYETVMGIVQSPSPTSAPPTWSPIPAYRENPRVQLPARRSLTRRRTEGSGTAAYCVRTCDGRYFPAPAADNESRAEGCRNLCPASETKLFFGASIDAAASQEGKAYSALPNAFRYRKELVPGCTCNGKDVAGLASVKVEDDKTLRRGDIVANKDGLEVVRSVSPGEPRLAALPKSERVRFAKPPIVASQ